MAGFTIKTIEPYEVKDDLKDWYTRASTNPRSTLILGRRAGISAFACAHDEDEITRGVERFAEDVRTGRISAVMRQYAWEGGEYMFTVAVR